MEARSTTFTLRTQPSGFRRAATLLFGWAALRARSATVRAASDPASHHRNHLEAFRDPSLSSALALRHRFFALRHGQSEANVAGRIASDPAVAVEQFGLTPAGLEQARRAGEALRRDFLEERARCCRTSAPVPRGIAVVCSDLRRARETAEAVVDVLARHNAEVEREGAGDAVDFCHELDRPQIDVRLRERAFGTWDGGSDAHYHDVWKDDALDPRHTRHGVESVWSVLDRATACVRDWDRTLEPRAEGDADGPLWIVLVAHGDVLQILQTGFAAMDPSRHRSLDHLPTATLRRLH